MRIVVLGCGDLDKISRFVSVSKKEIGQWIKETGQILAKKGHELIIVPDAGIPLEIAKAYRKAGGKRIIGLVPTHDARYGIRHIKKYLKLIDEQINFNTWYEVNGEIASAGQICLVFGISPGVLIEVMFLKYHYKYLKSKTQIYWFKPSLAKPLPPEIHEEIPIKYFNQISDLNQIL